MCVRVGENSEFQASAPGGMAWSAMYGFSIEIQYMIQKLYSNSNGTSRILGVPAPRGAYDASSNGCTGWFDSCFRVGLILIFRLV